MAADRAGFAAEIVPFGDRALLVELETLADVLALFGGLGVMPKGVFEVVPAARTLVIQFDPLVISGVAVAEWIRSVSPVEAGAQNAEKVEVPVIYDGPDLDLVADFQGISVQALITWHSSIRWQAAFTGFAPGFAYLVPADPAEALKAVPRRESPRPRLQPGTVALAGEFSTIYPTQSPGGWQLIGSQAPGSTPLWDRSNTEHPALIRPGTIVTFKAVQS